MSSKARVSAIWRAQLDSFRGYGRPSALFDFGQFLALPILAGIAAAIWAPPIYAVGSVLTGVSVFSGLLVALLVNVFELSVKIRRDEGLRPEEPLSVTMNELMANASWAVLVGLVLVTLLVAAAATQAPDCPLHPIWVGILVPFFAHLMVCVLMVLSRIWTAHEQIGDLRPPQQ